jgi:hypothetical protein
MYLITRQWNFKIYSIYFMIIDTIGFFTVFFAIYSI